MYGAEREKNQSDGREQVQEDGTDLEWVSYTPEE